METYTVLYKDEDCLPADPPLTFRCEAEDDDHAEEQCVNAMPMCDVVWVTRTEDAEEAYAQYYFMENHHEG